MTHGPNQKGMTTPSTTQQAEELSPDRRGYRRPGIKRFALTLTPYGVVMLALGALSVFGLVPPWQAAALSAYMAAGLLCFFLLLRSKFAARLSDPMLVFPQVLFSISATTLAYALIDIARPIALELLCLIIVFDMRRLSKSQATIAAMLAIVLPVEGLLLAWQQQSDAGKLVGQLVLLALQGMLVPILMLIAATGRQVHRALISHNDGMRRALELTRQIAIRDSLTGLFNRAHMQGLLEQEAGRQQRSEQPFCVAILDLDLFKRVNDQFGHAMGDTVLQQFAAIAMKALNNSPDVLARWGGEEFVLLLPETTQTRAHGVLMKLRALVHDYDWAQHHPALKVTFSAGVCEHRPGSNIVQTLAAADHALYQAKAQGRDRIEPHRLLTDADWLAIEAVQSALNLPADSAMEQGWRPVPPTHASAAPSQPNQGKATEPGSRAGVVGILGDWLLGHNPKMRRVMPSVLAAASVYLAQILAQIFYFVPTGFRL